MVKHFLQRIMIGISLAALAACGSAPYTPVATQAEPIDVTAYAPKVDSFVVLLDTSGSMKNDDEGRPKIYSAEDFVASFNNAVPPLDFKAGMVTYGKGSTGTCIGYGVATTIYGLAPYNATNFGNALGAIECAASTTPIAAAIDSTAGMLVEEMGPIAVIIVSDFNWNDPAAVEVAVANLKAQHGNNVCLHTVKVGDDTVGAEIISSITDVAGCDSAVRSGDFSSGAAISNYVVRTLLAPLDIPLQYEKHVISALTLFDFNKTFLKEQGKAELLNLAALIRSQGASVGDIDVIGHTDSVGSDAYNQGLSVRRAAVVQNYLVRVGVDSGLIDVMGMGKRQPVASNETAEGRAKNRRVEVHVGTKRAVK
jgi:OOP family OmpA-OmpF porin